MVLSNGKIYASKRPINLEGISGRETAYADFKKT